MRTVLRSVSATGGFLEHCHVEFAPGLTCVIGARGTCKSTLIESIRFAFDKDERRIAEITARPRPGEGAADGVIPATLGAGMIRCEVEVTDTAGTAQHRIEREADGEPRLFQDNVREHATRAILDGIEVFSQGALQRIAEDGNDELRLELIDKPNAAEVKRLLEQRRSHTAALQQIGTSLRTLRSQVGALRQEVQPLEALREELRQAVANSPALSPELEQERDRYERRRQAVGHLEQLDVERRAALEAVAGWTTNAGRARTAHDALAAEAVVDVGDALATAADVLDAFEAAAAAVARLGAVDVAAAAGALRERFDRENAPYYELRQAQQVVNEALKQQQHLTRQVEHLERRSAELTALLGREQDLITERARLRAEVERVDDALYELRVTEVDAINREHSAMVQLALRTGSGARRYVQRLSQLLTGSRIRAQEDVAAALADAYSPGTLIDLVETGNAQPLAELLGRDLGQMNRVVAHLGDHAELYTLENEPPAVQLDITLYDGGQPKPVESLSKGQKATALLPLILRPMPFPLLFDQPEDDLDNKFIIATLIDTIRTLKAHRQLIFVTHNANIPVLGAADHVVVMRMRTPDKADAPLVGTVDERKRDILDLLEGGADAFLRREERYHDVLDVALGSRTTGWSQEATPGRAGASQAASER